MEIGLLSKTAVTMTTVRSALCAGYSRVFRRFGAASGKAAYLLQSYRRIISQADGCHDDGVSSKPIRWFMPDQVAVARK
jgi:hypothetical protein